MAADAHAAVAGAAGWIMLPPAALIRDWALADLRRSAVAEPPGCLRLEPDAPIATGLDPAGDRPTSGFA